MLLEIFEKEYYNKYRAKVPRERKAKIQKNMPGSDASGIAEKTGVEVRFLR